MLVTGDEVGRETMSVSKAASGFPLRFGQLMELLPSSPEARASHRNLTLICFRRARHNMMIHTSSLLLADKDGGSWPQRFCKDGETVIEAAEAG